MRPSLQCQLEIQAPRKFGNIEINHLYLTEVAGRLVAFAKNQEMVVGPFVAEQAVQAYEGHPSTTTLSVWLDWATIERLEQLRVEGDGHIHFRVEGGMMTAAGWAFPRGGVPSGPGTIQLDGFGEARYVRDDWLQDLRAIGYREMRVYEGPPIDLPKEWNVTDHFDKAWLVLHQGHADDAMQECRKALEGVKKALTSKGLATTQNGEVKIDFRALTSSDVLGETLSKTWTGIWGFLTPGQHYGKTIRYADGEFALFATLALVRYVAQCVDRLG